MWWAISVALVEIAWKANRLSNFDPRVMEVLSTDRVEYNLLNETSTFTLVILPTDSKFTLSFST